MSESSLPLHREVVYGPIRSRRLGTSLGINLLPPGLKLCNFNCAYCQYGWTQAAPGGQARRWPSATQVARALSRRLDAAVAGGDRFDRLTIAGHGEPTLHPSFAEVVSAICGVRDRLMPDARLAILSNSTRLNDPSIVRALGSLDDRFMKLDAGDVLTLRRLNASGVPLAEIVAGLRRLPDVVVQAMFVDDLVNGFGNAEDPAVAYWLKAIEAVQPSQVQVYTIDRPAAWSSLQPVSTARLQLIARRVRRRGIPASSFGAAA
jgi:wyosine [tRNA(Phe)-imidazoG37] synthetase (radical SAM superfamily)